MKDTCVLVTIPLPAPDEDGATALAAVECEGRWALKLYEQWLPRHYAGGTRKMYRNDGYCWHKTIKRTLARKKPGEGLQTLVCDGRTNESFEAIALRHPSVFTAEERNKAALWLVQAVITLAMSIEKSVA
jgi:hypothetical protein